MNGDKTSVFRLNDSDSPKMRYAKAFVYYMSVAYSMASSDRHGVALLERADELVHYLSDSHFQIGMKNDHMKLLAQLKKLYMTHKEKLEQSGTVIKSMSDINYLNLIEQAGGKKLYTPWLPFAFKGRR